MGETKLKSVVAVFMVVFGVGIFASTMAQAFMYAPLEDLEVPAPVSYQHSAPPGSGPVRLIVPAVEIDAPIQHTGITRRGTMAVPATYRDVGWYRYGVLPGKRGSAVMAGHVDNGVALPAVFARLSELQKGDSVYVDTAEGKRMRFVVEEVRYYPYQEVPTEVLFGRNDAVRLNLITCAGEWLSEESTYDQRLVVYAMLAA